MRQVNIKELKKNLSRELQDLPFEITKFGKVVGVVCEKGSHLENEKVVTTSQKGSHLKKIKVKLEKIVKERSTASTSSVTGQGWINPLINTALAPKG
ncbi:MAG: hypothetical protein ABIF11_01190 [Nitrospirota bacterium]